MDILDHVGLKLQAAETETRKDGIPPFYLPNTVNDWIISIQIVATYAFVSTSFVVMKYIFTCLFCKEKLLEAEPQPFSWGVAAIIPAGMLAGDCVGVA